MTGIEPYIIEEFLTPRIVCNNKYKPEVKIPAKPFPDPHADRQTV